MYVNIVSTELYYGHQNQFTSFLSVANGKSVLRFGYTGTGWDSQE